MKATGGELGWLTWPLDQGDKPGVSPSLPPSLPQLPRSHLEFAFRIKYCREGAIYWTFDSGAVFADESARPCARM